MADEFENNDSPNVETENDNSSNVNEPTEETQVDDVEVLKEQNRQLFARAKKAEGFELKDGKWVKPTKPEVKEAKPEVKSEPTMPTKDIMALINAKVTEEEDITEVEEYARYKGISISEALKSTVVKSVLAEKAEQRKTAQATNVKPGSSRAVKVSADEQIEKKFLAGEELSEEEIQKNYQLRRQKLLQKNKK